MLLHCVMKSSLIIFTVVGTGLMLSACNPYGPQDTYREDAIGMTQDVKTGVIASITPVRIKGNDSNTGTALGAVAGGFAGNTLGGGSGKTLFTAGGALAGALAGSQIQQGVDAKDGIRLVVKLDGEKKSMSVTQEKDPRRPLYVGQNVNIYIGYKGSFVEAAGSGY